MTRINVVPVEQLCDAHLLAEHRELTRIPNGVIAGDFNLNRSMPSEYTVQTADNPKGGKGHVSFFIHKMSYLKKRYKDIRGELIFRDLKAENRWPSDDSVIPDRFWGDYNPTEKAIKLNTTRIIERTPKNLRYYKKTTNQVLTY